MRINKAPVRKYSHRLVADLWLEKKSKDAIYVGHKDGNLKNNHYSNLEWLTKEELLIKRREITKMKAKPGVVANINNSKLKESDVRVLKGMLNRGIVQSTIAKLFRISEMQVTRIKRGENWGHIKL
jgi:DNA-directed RNA polymerase specialized sigma subunit